MVAYVLDVDVFKRDADQQEVSGCMARLKERKTDSGEEARTCKIKKTASGEGAKTSSGARRPLNRWCANSLAEYGQGQEHFYV